MENKELLVVFEKMYLQENEIKEKITIRVQIVFTLILAVIAVSSYMLRMLDFSQYAHVAYAIISLAFGFYSFLSISCFYAIKAFWGNTFKQVPPAMEVRGYCNALRHYNSEKSKIDFDGEPELIDVKGEVESYLCDAYEECATHNSELNQVRSRRVHLSFKWLLFSLAPLSLSGVLFVSFDMDVSSPRKNFQVIDKYVGDQLSGLNKSLDRIVKKTEELKEIAMSNEKTNPSGSKKGGEPTPVPVGTAPAKPQRPPMRIVLEDDRSISIEVNHETTKK